MRIIIILHGSSFGGTEQHLINLVPGLSKEGYRCCVLTDQENLLVELDKRQIENEYICFDNYSMAILKIRKFINDECDMVLAHRVDSLAFAYLALKSTKIPLICTIHSIYKEGVLEGVDSSSGKVISISSNYLLNKTNTIIAISNAVKVSLIEAGINESKIKVIYNGVGNSESIKSQNNKKYTIGFIGRLHYEKGPDILIDAFKILSEKYKNQMRLRIVGDGPMKMQIVDLIKEREIEDLCEIKGYVADSISEYAELDVLVLPSREEGMGLVLLEAFSAKVPVVASEVGGVTELIENCKTGILFEAEKSEVLANSLEKLYTNPVLAQNLVNKAYMVWEQNYTISIFVQEHIELLNKMKLLY